MEFQRLYPQYNVSNDRRKQNIDVPQERRTGIERRSEDRISLDTDIMRDLYDVKDKVSKISGSNFNQSISTAATNSIYSDQFVRTNKPNHIENVMKNNEPPSSTAIMGGILLTALSGVMAGALFGTIAGVGVALGIGAYMGGKILKQAIVEHMTESEKNKKNDRK